MAKNGSGTEDMELGTESATSESAIRERASEVAQTANEMARRLPDTVDQAATTTGRMLETAQQTLESESDETLLAGTALATGLMFGLLVGGAPRLLAWVAMVPAAAMGVTLARRRSSHGSSIG